MKHALSLFLHTLCPSFLSPLCSSFSPLPNTSLLFFPGSFTTCHVHVLTISHVFFSAFPSHLFSRGAGVIGALSLLGQRATGSGQRTLRAGFRPGRRAPVRPSLRPSSRTHPAPAAPGRVGPRDAKVQKLNTCLSSNKVSRQFVK